jgi:hypothetical protein
MSLTVLLIILLVLALLGGGFSRFGAWGWSPAGLLVVVLVILWLTGRL